MKKISSRWNDVRTIISEAHAKMNPHVIELTSVTMHEAQDEEITQLHEVDHIMLQGEFGKGTLDFINLKRTRYD